MATPFKMKGSPMKRNFGIGASPMRDKPTQKELTDAANNPDNPNSLQNLGETAYYAWKQGSTVAPSEEESKLTHGAGGKLLNPDGTVNKEATRENVENLTT
tara:strand:+ start:248 stop:550 length:303 start_codon:yes stop_codon:yes gene_type:complete